ncbi:MAG: glycosyltransferase family 4 protein [Candidatus Helarchaeota archaeon]
MQIGMFSEVPTFNPVLPNGVSSFIEATSKELARLGHDVHIYEAKIYFGQKSVEQIRKNITIHRFFSLPMSHYQGFRVPIPLGAIFKGIKEELDVIHAHGPVNGITATSIGKFRNIVKIVTYHTPGEEYRRYVPPVFAPVRTSKFVDTWEKLIYNSFDLILTPCEQWRRNLIQKNYDSHKIFVLPNCVDLNENHKRITEERMQQLRDYYGLNGKKVILYVGRMSPEKRIPDIISLAPQIVQEEPDTHFLIVGKGPYLNEYRTLAQKIAPKNVTFTGYVSDTDLSNILHLSSLGVIFVDGAQVFDITLLNYWSNRLPVCVRRAGGMGDVVTHYENGLLFDHPKEAYNYILNILQDDKLRKKIGERGYETVKTKYSVEAVTKQMLGYYRLASQKFHNTHATPWGYVLRIFKKLKR